MALTLPLIQHGLSEPGPSPSVDDEHPSTFTYLTLSLPSQQLTDISALTSFPYLISLDLSHNPLTTLTPLSSLPHLTFLSLSHCRLSSFTLSSPLSSLLTLNLSHNSLSSLPSLPIHPFLTSLTLRHNALPSLSLHPLTHLTHLDASHNPSLLTLSPLSLPPSLTSLTLSHCSLYSLHSFPLLPHLLHLDLSHNFFQSLAPLPTLTSSSSSHPLHTLLLSHNYFAHLDRLSSLTALPHLHTLTLSPCPLSHPPPSPTPIPSSPAPRQAYRPSILYLLPSLTSLDASPVLPVEVLLAWEGEGREEPYRDGVRRWLWPEGGETVEGDVREEVKGGEMVGKMGRMEVVKRMGKRMGIGKGGGREGAEGDVEVRARLGKVRYWQLMSERGFVHPWAPLYNQLQRRAMAGEGKGDVVDLSGVAMGEVGLRALAEFLRSSPAARTVRSLDLSGSCHPARPSSLVGGALGLQELVTALQVTTIHTLSLARCRLSEADVGMVLLLPSAAHLRHLDVSHNALGGHVTVDGVTVDPCPALHALLAAVEKEGRLLRLDLSHNAVDVEGGRAVADWVQRGGGGVVELVLDGNDVADDAVHRLALAMRVNARLTSLSVRAMGRSAPSQVTAASLTALLASVCKYNTTLEALDLSDNPGLAGVTMPARLSPALTALHLSLPSQSVHAMPTFPVGSLSALSAVSLSGWAIAGSTAGALLSAPHLTHVKLGRLVCRQGLMWGEGLGKVEVLKLEGSGGDMEADEEALLLAVASSTPKLREFTLHRFSLSSAFSARLLPLLSVHPFLTSLSLLGCAGSPDALTQLFDGLSPCLHQLDLSETVIPSFSYALPASSSLTSLVLSRCAIASFSQAAVSSWQQSPSLTALDLSHNVLTAHTLSMLSTLPLSAPSLRQLRLHGTQLPSSSSTILSLSALLRHSSSLHSLSLPTLSPSPSSSDPDDAPLLTSRLLHALTESGRNTQGGRGVEKVWLGKGLAVEAQHRRQLVGVMSAGGLGGLEWVEGGDVDDGGGCDVRGLRATVEEDAVENAFAAMAALHRLA